MKNIVHIPSTAPFLDSLVSAILNGDLPHKGGTPPDDEHLTKYTLLLPTKRACRTCRESFLRLSGRQAILLPRIRPIGEANEDESLLHDSLSETGSDKSLIDMNPAISSLERHLVLTRLILAWLESGPHRPELASEFMGGASPHHRPSQASLMARELAKLLDSAETEEVDLSKLENLVPDHFSNHWQQTLSFLSIITEEWPNYLKSTNQMNGATRRNLLLTKEAERFLKEQPSEPIIVAGSTGSIPAAARLMAAIASLKNGVVVLPGLDQNLDKASFEKITENHPEHPQFGLTKLIADLEVTRVQINLVPKTEPTSEKQTLTNFIHQALRPSSTTEHWQTYIEATNPSELEKSFENISLSVTRDAQEEAEMISLILRRAANEPGQTAALITPDRLLARRVAVRLEEWGIKVDDSGGRPLVKTMPGAFFDSIIKAAERGFEPSYLLALLKHPLTRLEFDRGDVRLAARSLEVAALRQSWLGGGLNGLENALLTTKQRLESAERVAPAIKRLSETEWDLALKLCQRLIEAFAPLTTLYANKDPNNLHEFINAHVQVAENLAKNSEGESNKLWQGASGEHLSALLSEILSTENLSPPLTQYDYPEFYRSLIAGETVRPLTPVHPRIFIWGPFEARLQQPDIVILGGLNEGTWPASTNASPWLSRPMCEALGLPSPEQHIGYSAHDFTTLLCANQVYLTRAAKSDGVETVPSRWLMRIEALLEGLKATYLLESSEQQPFGQWATLRDQVDQAEPIQRPMPKPPVKARPRQLSVTRIEDWIANPYSIFASHILSLIKLDPIGAPPDAALKGQLIHTAMQQFTQIYPNELPKEAEEKLVEIGEQLMQEISHHPQIGAFWRPRFNRFAAWFAATETERRKACKAIYSEKDGRLTLEADNAPFTLTGRADRIDHYQDGSFAVYDYKTGTVPTKGEVKSLVAPQLPLEAAMLKQGGFAELAAGPVTKLSYIAAKGGEPAGSETSLEGESVDELIIEALSALEQLIIKFDDPETPYAALRRHQFKNRYKYDDYAHLARIDEWAERHDGGES